MSVPVYLSLKDSGVEWLGDVPSHWPVHPGRRLFRQIREPGREGDEQLSASQKYGIIPQAQLMALEDQKVVLALKGLDGFKHVEADDFVISLRSFQGGIEHSAYCGCVSPAYTVLRPTAAQFSRYYYYTLKCDPYIAALQSVTDGIRDGKNISFEQFGVVGLPTPPIDEQATIAAFLDRETAKIDALVEEQRRLIALLKEKRQAVIFHAVTKGLNPDSPMKNSGIEWLGEVPAHWGVKPLKYLISLRSGGTPSKARDNFWDGHIPWASAKDLKSERLSDTLDHISDAAVREGGAGINPAGSILILVRGMMLARAFPVVETLVPMAINQDLKAVSAKSGMTVQFLAWALRGTAQESLDRCSEAGHGTKALRMEDWLSMPLPLPPENAQAAIADFVGTRTQIIDELESEAVTAILLLQERRAALISAAVTGKIDVRGIVFENKVLSISLAREQSNLPSLRAVVGAYAIRNLGVMGRMGVMKAGFLAESHAGFGALDGRYARKAAGPYDASLIASMERGAAEICAIQTIDPQAAGKPVTYIVPKGFRAPLEALEALVGEDRAKGFLAMLSLLKGIGRDGVEAVATIYAVWNDFLAADASADDAAIFSGVLNEWHDEKRQKFKRTDLEHWLAWMRRNGMVPDGSAPRTDNQRSLFG